MSTAALITLVSACLANTPHDARINTDLIVAFATVESACNPTALGDEVSLKTAKKVPHKHIFGTKRVKRRGKWANVPAAWKSWGLYQFQYDRWVESGGKASDWGKADAKEQTRVMVKALENYLDKHKKGDHVTWVTTSHNSGHGLSKPTPYTRKIKAEIVKIAAIIKKGNESIANDGQQKSGE
jgi:hypothetical protein